VVHHIHNMNTITILKTFFTDIGLTIAQIVGSILALLAALVGLGRGIRSLGKWIIGDGTHELTGEMLYDWNMRNRTFHRMNHEM